MNKLTGKEYPEFSSDFVPDIEWQCAICKTEFRGYYRWHDIIVVNNLGFCIDCQGKVLQANPDLQKHLASTQAHIAASHGFSNKLLDKVHSYENRPGWWKSSLP